MAKGKHATALFEVIQHAKKPPIKKSGGPFPALRSLFGCKPNANVPTLTSREPKESPAPAASKPLPKPARSSSPPVNHEPIEPPSHIEHDPTADPAALSRLKRLTMADARIVAYVDSDDVDEPAAPPAKTYAPTYTPPAVERPVEDRVEKHVEEPVRISHHQGPAFQDYSDHDSDDAHVIADDDYGDEARGSHGRRDRSSQSDRSGKAVHFKMNYGTAVLAAMVVFVLLGGMYIAGSRFGVKPPFTSLMPTPVTDGGGDSTPVSGQAVQPSVMDVRPMTPQEATNASARNPASAVLANQANQTTSTTVKMPDPAGPIADVPPEADAKPANAAVGTAAVPTAVKRTVGLNYVIAQSYPDIDHAQKAQAVLLRAGISCTIVKGPPGYAMRGWYSVIGTAGFGSRLSTNPIYQKYRDKIESASDAFIGGSKAFMRFDPKPFKWTDAAEQSANPE